MMATLLVGVLLLVALYFALRHVVRNLREGTDGEPAAERSK